MNRLKRVISGTSVAVLSLSSLLTMGFTGVAHAAVQTCTWTGGGADNKFSTVANWSNCAGSTPLEGDIVEIDRAAFANNATTAAVDNDLTVALGGFRTKATGGSTSLYNLDVTALKLVDGGFIETIPATTGPTLGISLSVASGTQPKLEGLGDVDIRTYNFIAQGGYNVTGQIILTESAYLELPDTATIGGLSMVKGSSTRINNSGSDKTLDFPVTTATSASSYSPGLTFESKCTEYGTGDQQYTCMKYANVTYTLSGAMTLAVPLEVYVPENVTVQFTGTIDTPSNIVFTIGSNGVLKVGSTEITFPVKSTEITGDKGTEYVQVAKNETVTMAEGSKRSSITVYSGGILKGVGTIANGLYVAKGAVVAPGMSPGCLTTDRLTLSGDYSFELGGTDPCTGYDQIKVTNTTLTYATTSFGADATITTSRFNGYTPKQGQTFSIIEVAGSQAVDGTFKGLPEGATFEQNGVVFKISYKGGDGNDVVLTVQNQPTAPDTGFALLSANPLLTLGATAGAAAVLVAMARKTRPAHARVHARRRK